VTFFYQYEAEFLERVSRDTNSTPINNTMTKLICCALVRCAWLFTARPTPHNTLPSTANQFFVSFPSLFSRTAH
jgi:hypothetical protein